jgi:DNA-binding transcriptional regulator YiaG
MKQKPMTGAQMQIALDKIGLSQVGFAKTIAKSDRTVRHWIAGSYPVPREIAMLLNLMIKTQSTEEDLKA